MKFSNTKRKQRGLYKIKMLNAKHLGTECEDGGQETTVLGKFN